MVDPEYFDVVYVINPHMKDQVGKVDHKKARVQWKALRTVYEKLGFPVEVLPGVPGLPDMVFAANQSFPFVTSEGKKKVILSRVLSTSLFLRVIIMLKAFSKLFAKFKARPFVLLLSIKAQQI